MESSHFADEETEGQGGKVALSHVGEPDCGEGCSEPEHREGSPAQHTQASDGDFMSPFRDHQGEPQ